MKNLLLSFSILLFAANSFGQYGSGIVHTSASPTHNQALAGIDLDGTKAYSCDILSGYCL